MITTNGAKILLAMILKSTLAVGDLTDINGDTNSGTLNSTGFSFSNMASSSSAGVRMYFGAGDTAEQESDYALDDAISSSTNGSCGKIGNDKWYCTATYANTSQSPVTIKEIGVAEFRYSNSKNYLIARKVVPARTLAAGETATFTFTLDF